MKISVNQLQFYRKAYNWSPDPMPDGIEALVQKINAQLGAVETVEDLGAKYRGVVVAKVVSCRKHENSDHLNVCLLDDGGSIPDVKRDENGYVQVVCGAPNVREGLLVAWLPPGSTVPESVGKEPFVLEARELRGVVSNGMIASARELALGDSHEGILELDDTAKPGDDFAHAFGLDDHIIDIENKMFTHRPDCFGMIGIARELAGIQGLPFKSPDWYRLDAPLPAATNESLPLEVINELPAEVPRFMAVAMAGVSVESSPLWLQINLLRLGVRPINNIVDLTNFFMLLTGQPLHAYDYDKVRALDGTDGVTLTVRYPRSGEKIKLLNGKEIEPRAEAIMIASQTTLIGVGGVMGSADTEVDDTTKNIILEAATFDMYSIRRTSMAHGLFTDAVTRFSKGQSPLQNQAVLAKIAGDIAELAGGQVASQWVDSNQLGERVWVHPPVPVEASFVTARLGLQLSADDMGRLLQHVEFQVSMNGEQLTIAAPFWRTDIETREDVVEEIGRLYGFDKLPLELPRRSLKPTGKNLLLELKSQVRDVLADSGANEVLTYSFVHGDLLSKVGQDTSLAFQLSNALSPDLQYYRLSLLPSLLEKIHPNIKAGYDEFALFELGKAHVQGEPDPYEPEVPKEVNALAWVYASKTNHVGAAYYRARWQLMRLLKTFQAETVIRLEPLETADLYNNPWLVQMAAPFEPGRSAVLRDVFTDTNTTGLWGVVGEFKASVRRSLKLPTYAAGFELDPLLLGLGTPSGRYVPLSRFPKVTQDITLKALTDLPYQTLYDFLNEGLRKLQLPETLLSLEPIDIYQRDDDAKHKQITLRLTVTSYERTLTDPEVARLLDGLAAAAHDKFQAERV